MLEKDKTEVVDPKDSLDNREKLMFHYENGVSCSDETPTIRDTLETLFSKKKAKTIVLFVMSALLLCLAFLPFVTIEDVSVDTKEYSLDFNCVECVELSVKSLYSLSDEELMETELAKEVLSDSNSVSEKLLKKQIYLTAMSENMPINSVLIVLGVVSLGYICLCILLFVLSLLNLIMVVAPSVKRRLKLPRFLQNAESLFGLLPCVMPVVFFSALQGLKAFQRDGLMMGKSGATVGLTFGAYFALTISIVATAIVCLGNLLDIAKVSEWVSKKNVVKYLGSGILVLAIILLVFAPWVTISVSSEAQGQEVDISYDFMNFTEMSESHVAYYESMSPGESYTDLLDYIQANSRQTVVGNEGAEHIMGLLSIGYSGFPVNIIYMMLNMLSVMILMFSGAFLWSILQNAFWNKNNCRRINRIRVISLVCVVAYFILLMVFNAWINLCLSEKTPNMLSMSLGMAPVMMLIAIVGTMFFSFDNVDRAKKKAKSDKSDI